ncbi:MAG: 3-phosphoshikimate 1-carboxyvinyltransferase [Ignavibacteriaceae bacterium]|jgi:3-phosphoshikimate 1-carboxyvinyltransferase
MLQEFNKIEKVEGTLELPGDKSISHRSVMFASMAKGKSRIYNLSNGEDVKSSQKCFMQLGAEINNKNKFIEIKGRGFKEFIKPDAPLDAGNSGTTTRLISGILIAQDFESVITGDESLSQRPMKRIITPLTAMGGRITATEKFTLPLTISPSGWISPIYYELPVASAQVKSAVLLAGLHCKGTTSVFEKLPSRDHTEKMLGLSTKITDAGKISYASQSDYPESKEYFVPSDISTAAFFIVLTLLSDNSELRIKDVSLNETRTGILTVLKQMGAKIETEDEKTIAGEAMGDVKVKSSNLINIEIPAKLIPNIIDEIPVLAIAGIFAEGEFKLKHAAELRGKETDRIKAICHNLKMLGLKVEEVEDGFSFSGEIKNYSQVFESFGDHRIAMAFGILSLIMPGGGKVNSFECAAISNPDFMNQLKQICV